MEKFCPKCGRVFNDLDFEVCPVCKISLMERPGRIKLPKGLREEVFRRDGYTCQMCGASRDNGAELEIDHKTPVSLGGTNDIENLQTLCRPCNQNKSNLILPSGLKIDVEIKENELKTLTRLLQKNMDKLNNATNENDRIEYSFNIKHLEERIQSVSKELDELRTKYHEEQETIRIQKEEQEKQELLFKKLYVKLTPVEKSLLKEKFDLNNMSDDEALKTLCKKYSEKEILVSIEDYKTEMHQTLEGSIKFNMLPLLSSGLQLEGSSKPVIINHLITNYNMQQIKNILETVNNELFKQYNSSFDNIEKALLKRHYSLNDASDNELINYVIENDFSIDELKNTIESSYKNVFQEFYNKLNENQKHLVKFRFENSKKNLVDFLATHNFSSKELTDELNRAKLELYNKTFNSLTNDNQTLIERYFKKYSQEIDSINYFYENKFSEEKINDLIEISKKDLIDEVHQTLNNHHMFLLENTFENDDELIDFMIKNNYSFNKLLIQLENSQNEMHSNLDKTLTRRQKFLLKKYFSVKDNQKLIIYLINNEYNIKDSVEIATNYKNKLYDEFDNNLNYDFEQILYKKFSLSSNSKNMLIDYLIYEGYTVESMKNLIKQDVFNRYDEALDTYSTSLLYYKFKLHTVTKISSTPLRQYLFDNNYTLYSVHQSIAQAKKELSNELDEKLDYQTVYLINKQLNIPNSKTNLISHLVDNCTVELTREILKEYDISI